MHIVDVGQKEEGLTALNEIERVAPRDPQQGITDQRGKVVDHVEQRDRAAQSGNVHVTDALAGRRIVHGCEDGRVALFGERAHHVALAASNRIAALEEMIEYRNSFPGHAVDPVRARWEPLPCRGSKRSVDRATIRPGGHRHAFRGCVATLASRSRTRWSKKRGLLVRYRFHSRRGSIARRKAHSMPLLWMKRGACRTIPEQRSKAAPTPIRAFAESRSTCAAIQRSCLGVLRPTQTMFGAASLMMRTISSSSAWVSGR